MKKILALIIAIFIVLALITLVTVLATGINEYEFDNRGMYQVKDLKVTQNSTDQSQVSIGIAQSSFNVVRSSIRFLTRDQPVFVGEREIIDNTLGDFRVELTLSDSSLQSKLINQFLTNTYLTDPAKTGFLQSIRVAYPGDDATMVIYFGFDKKPQVELISNFRNVTLNFTK